MYKLYYYILFVFLIIIPIVFILYNVVSKKDNTTHDSPSPGNVLSDPKELNSSLGSLRTLTESIATQVKDLKKTLTESIGVQTEFVKTSTKDLDTKVSTSLTSLNTNLGNKFVVKDFDTKVEALSSSGDKAKAKLQVLALAPDNSLDKASSLTLSKELSEYKAKLEASDKSKSESEAEYKAKIDSLSKELADNSLDKVKLEALSKELSGAKAKLEALDKAKLEDKAKSSSEYTAKLKAFFWRWKTAGVAGAAAASAAYWFDFYSTIITTTVALTAAYVNFTNITTGIATLKAKAKGYFFQDAKTANEFDLELITAQVGLDKLNKSLAEAVQIEVIINDIEKLATKNKEVVKIANNLVTPVVWYNRVLFSKKYKDALLLNEKLKDIKLLNEQLTKQVEDLKNEHNSINLPTVQTKFDNYKTMFTTIDTKCKELTLMVNRTTYIADNVKRLLEEEKKAKLAFENLDKTEKEKEILYKKEQEQEILDKAVVAAADKQREIDANNFEKQRLKEKKMRDEDTEKYKKTIELLKERTLAKINEAKTHEALQESKRIDNLSLDEFLAELSEAKKVQEAKDKEAKKVQEAKDKEAKETADKESKRIAASFLPKTKEEFKRLESAKKESKRIAASLAASTEAFYLLYRL